MRTNADIKDQIKFYAELANQHLNASRKLRAVNDSKSELELKCYFEYEAKISALIWTLGNFNADQSFKIKKHYLPE